eukprot:TRINITY_DN2595_c1_g1_i7.p1 TRINITY_DN2595_c1_g1~~TRINITY_DN2595_c1_g1_i7.p1  ORF type:complete len:181 (-),score=49.30 TRINITY_DN2595_c1_g1_i7:156-698(-)
MELTQTSQILSSNKIGDVGGIAIGQALSNNNTLKKLCINKNKIGDEGMAGICKALKHNHGIEILWVFGNKLTGKGAESIADALQQNTQLLPGLDMLCVDESMENMPCLKGWLDGGKVKREWIPERHSRYPKHFRDQVMQVLLMWNHDQYEDGECDGFEWNMLPWEVVLRVCKWLALWSLM